MVALPKAAPSAPQGRRGRPPNIERRRRIVLAAMREYARGSYANATMPQIAAAVGISPSLLYRYYPTKTQLFEAVIQHVLEAQRKLRRGIREAVREARSLRSLLRAVVTIAVEHASEFSAWYAMQFASLPLNGRHERELRASADDAMNLVTDVLRRYGKWNDPAVVARMTWYGVLSFVLYQDHVKYEPPDPKLRSVFMNELIALLLDAQTVEAASAKLRFVASAHHTARR